MPAVIALVFACTPEPGSPPPPAPAPRDPFADCPTLDWVVPVGDELPDVVHSVEGLPDGGVIVAGTYGGRPDIGLGPDDQLLPSENYRDGFVARLGPDGRTRWHHTIGSVGMDELPHMTWDDDRVWVAGTTDVFGDSPIAAVAIDRVAVTAPPPREVQSLVWAIGFDHQDGATHAVRVAEIDGAGFGTAATADPEGNVYLTGWWRTGDLEFGRWSFRPTFGSNGGHAFLLSWDADGKPRWATVLGDEDSLAQPIGLSWSDGKLQWAVEVRGGGGRAPAIASNGTRTDIDLGEMRGAVLAADAATGEVLPVQYRVVTNWIHRFEKQPGGALIATGYMNRIDQRWWDAAGVEQSHPGYGGFWAAVTPFGALQVLTSPGPFGDIRSSSGVGPAVFATAPPWEGVVGAGTPRELVIENGDPRDSVAVLHGDEGQFQCASWYSGPDNQDTLDAVLTEDGAYYVVGTFEGEMTVFEPSGAVSHPFVSRGYTDGFIARFAPLEP